MNNPVFMLTVHVIPDEDAYSNFGVKSFLEGNVPKEVIFTLVRTWLRSQEDAYLAQFNV